MARRRLEIMVRDRNPHPPVIFDDRNVYSEADRKRVETFPMDHPAKRLDVHIGMQERDVDDPIHRQ